MTKFKENFRFRVRFHLVCVAGIILSKICVAYP